MQKSEDEKKLNTNWIWIIFWTTIGVTFITYFIVFHGDLSTMSQDWGSFGSYVSGIMMPILTAINIWVFIKLTKAINDNNNKRQQEEVKLQTDRHKEELAFQKRKIITDLRQSEIHAFLSLWNNIGVSDTAIERFNQISFFQRYLTLFRKEKVTLFPGIIGKIEPMISKLREELVVKPHDTATDLTKAIPIKGEIISKLNNYMIDNI